MYSARLDLFLLLQINDLGDKPTFVVALNLKPRSLLVRADDGVLWKRRRRARCFRNQLGAGFMSTARSKII